MNRYYMGGSKNCKESVVQEEGTSMKEPYHTDGSMVIMSGIPKELTAHCFHYYHTHLIWV